jgi:LacI family transcriptional regulator
MFNFINTVRAMPTPMPSLRILASLTGYSLGTVSMALRGDPRISKKTQAVILKLAKEHGYEPDPLLAGRMSQIRRRSDSRRSAVKLAHVVAWDRLESYYEFGPFRDFREGAARRAREYGYELEDFLLDERHMSAKRLSGILRARACPGILIAPVQLSLAIHERQGMGVEGLNTQFAACSTIGYSLDMNTISRATHDHAGAIEMVCRRLRERDYRRIGLVLSEVMHRRVLGRWLAGWVCSQPDIYEAPRPLISATLADEKAFDSWFKTQRPDVILTSEWHHVHMHCRRLGLKIPQDIGLVDLQYAPVNASRAFVDQCDKNVGAAAIDIILAQINRHERGRITNVKTVLVSGQWVDGPTVRPAP